MPYKLIENARANALERSRRYRARKHRERYGPNAGHMNGRHGNHARGSRNGRWAGDRLLTSHGYVAVRVAIDHPHAWGPPGLRNFKYAYEHIIVTMEKIGRALRYDELVHHRNRNRHDNRIENLQLMTVAEHQRFHALETRERDELGRFAPDDFTMREMPKATVIT